MNLKAPAIIRKVFNRLCKGDNLLLSSNGPEEDADLFQQLEADDGNECREYFAALGLRLEKGNNYYFCTPEDEPQINIEQKLERLVKLLRLLDFLSTHIESFGEGVTFSAVNLAVRCGDDARSERFLQEAARGGNTVIERVESLLQILVRQGYLSEYDANRKEYRVLSAINYLFDFADRIDIQEQEEDTGEHYGEA